VSYYKHYVYITLLPDLFVFGVSLVVFLGFFFVRRRLVRSFGYRMNMNIHLQRKKKKKKTENKNTNGLDDSNFRSLSILHCIQSRSVLLSLYLLSPFFPFSPFSPFSPFLASLLFCFVVWILVDWTRVTYVKLVLLVNKPIFLNPSFIPSFIEFFIHSPRPLFGYLVGLGWIFGWLGSLHW